jgi:hypothetical protein
MKKLLQYLADQIIIKIDNHLIEKDSESALKWGRVGIQLNGFAVFFGIKLK